MTRGMVECGEPQVPLFQLFSVLNFKSWDSHIFYSVWDAFHHFFPNLHLFMEWGSSELIKHCHCVLVWKLNWMFHGKLWWKLPFEYLNIILNITSFSPLNTNVITTLKYYHKKTINKKLILIRGVMKFFTKKKCWARKYLVLWSSELQYISPLSYILNVHVLLDVIGLILNFWTAEAGTLLL